jgi:hypothetical protein
MEDPPMRIEHHIRVNLAEELTASCMSEGESPGFRPSSMFSVWACTALV